MTRDLSWATRLLAIAAGLSITFATMSASVADGDVIEQQGSRGANSFRIYHNASQMGARVEPRTQVAI